MASAMTVARPYAAAAFEFAKAHKKISQWASVLDVLAEVIRDVDIRVLLTHPMVGQENIATVLVEVMKKTLDTYQVNFIRLLAEQRRLMVLPEIQQVFVDEQLADQDIVVAEMITADKVTKTVVNAVQKALTVKTGKEVELTHHIDDSLIGGAVVKMGDHVIDASLKGQLERLAQQLIC